MKTKTAVLTLCAMLFALGTPAEAQQAEKVYRIGYLTNAAGIRKEVEETFRHALRELGYIEGRNFAIEWRFF